MLNAFYNQPAQGLGMVGMGQPMPQGLTQVGAMPMARPMANPMMQSATPIAQRPHFAVGGMAPPPGASEQPTGNVADMVRGPLGSPVAGRTDHLPISAAQGSYVIPADVVSALGQGNTNAGFAILRKMFPPASSTPGAGQPVNIMAAGGEFVVPPEDVARVGNGNMKLGHTVLDQWVKKLRSQYRGMLGKIPGPAKS